MNVEETKKAIEVMQAFVDGKQVEFRNGYKGAQWATIMPNQNVDWNFFELEYRIKKEPMEFYLIIDSNNNVVGCSAKHNDFIVVPDAVDIKLTRTIRVRELLE